MPAARTLFPELETMQTPELHIRYTTLREAALTRDLSDDELYEMVAITGLLRRRSTLAKPKRTSTLTMTLGDL